MSLTLWKILELNKYNPFRQLYNCLDQYTTWRIMASTTAYCAAWRFQRSEIWRNWHIVFIFVSHLCCVKNYISWTCKQVWKSKFYAYLFCCSCIVFLEYISICQEHHFLTDISLSWIALFKCVMIFSLMIFISIFASTPFWMKCHTDLNKSHTKHVILHQGWIVLYFKSTCRGICWMDWMIPWSLEHVCFWWDF